MSEWKPIETAPLDTPIHVYGWNECGPAHNRYRYYFTTIGELDRPEGYAHDLMERGCDCVTGHIMDHPELWAPFPDAPHAEATRQ